MPPTTSLSLDSTQLQSLWEETCTDLSGQLSPLLIDAWGKTSNLHQIEIFDDQKWLCTFACPSSFNALQFEKNIAPAAKTALEKRLAHPVELKFIFNVTPATSAAAQVAANPAPVTSVPSALKPQYSNNFQGGQGKRNSSVLNVHEFRESAVQHRKLPNSEVSDFGEGLFSQTTVAHTLISRAATIARGLGLRPDFTFDTFAVSGSNEMAHVAAMSVAKNPGISYNPLFLYGGVGVGKTHLMQSIGNHILQHQPETKVIYCTGEDFTNSVIRAIQNKHTFNLKDKFRTCDVLLIDDVQFIAGKNAVQEEFFHTFNSLVRQNHQIVLTSDRPPHEISLLESRMRSRFEAGLKIDIQQPSFELRSAILLIKAKAANLDLPIEFAQTIASRIDSARKLEGAVMRLKSEIELKNRQIDQELINSLLAEHQQQEYSHRRLHPKEVISAVANHYSIKQSVICGTRRQKEIIQARHVAMFLLKSELSLSYAEIGKIFSNRDHTSVLHGVTKINDALKTDSFLSQEVAAIKTSILGGAP